MKIIQLFISGLTTMALNAQTSTTFKDSRDGNVYKTVKIGNQTWMAENLRYLPSVVAPDSGSNTLPLQYVYGYKGNSVAAAKATASFKTYGVLYNWPAANKACPAGWHLSHDSDWKILIIGLGGYKVAGGKLKEAGTTHWQSPNEGGTNDSGFTALPGGYRYSSGVFDGQGKNGAWWTSTVSDAELSIAFYREIDYDFSETMKVRNNYNMGWSVRCVKD
ncbi:MAG: hypothetical protein JNL57_05095 [Bacteroidetes bacterium]|nr:hypothetical protein [Bacteroidota bacterium]